MKTTVKVITGLLILSLWTVLGYFTGYNNGVEELQEENTQLKISILEYAESQK